MNLFVITNSYINTGDGCARLSSEGTTEVAFPGGRFPGGRLAGGGCPGGRFPGGYREGFWPGT